MSERISAGATVFTVFAVFNRCFRERRGEHTETPNFSLRELAGKRSKTVGKRSQNGAAKALPCVDEESAQQRGHRETPGELEGGIHARQFYPQRTRSPIMGN